MRSLIPVRTSGRASLAKPGSTPLTKSDTPAAGGGGDEGLGHGVVVGRELQEDRAGRDHVDAGGQEALQVGQGFEHAVVGHGGMHDAVGLERQQCVNVRGPEHAEGRAQPGQLAGIAPDLVRVGDEEADQFQVGPGLDTG